MNVVQNIPITRKQCVIISAAIILIFMLCQLAIINLMGSPENATHDSEEEEVRIHKFKEKNRIIENVLDNLEKSEFKLHKTDPPSKDETVKKKRGINQRLGDLGRTWSPKVKKAIGNEKGGASSQSKVLGVLASFQKYYVAQDGMFICLKSKQKIAFRWVNDDFCDCLDGTDEPGTSACPKSRFYCSHQQSSSHPISIPSSRVNDGVCDCCDGSDEYIVHNRTNIAQIFKRCKNTCLNSDQQPIRFANGKTDFRGFETLSHQCFTYDGDAKHLYTVCPFFEVRQQTNRWSSAIVLGRTNQWVDDGKTKLKMIDGDKNLCPGDKKRSAEIHFDCARETKVIAIKETKVCEYQVTLATKFAC